MKTSDKIRLEGRAQNHGLPFDLVLSVYGVSKVDQSTIVLLNNPLNQDKYVLDLTYGSVQSLDSSDLFYADDLHVFNITQNIRIF